MKNWKKIVLWASTIAIIGGMVVFTRFQIKLYNAILISQRGLADVVNFIKTEFPEQANHYIQAQNAKNGGSQLPAVTPAPAK